MKFICMYLWDVIIDDVVIDDNVIMIETYENVIMIETYENVIMMMYVVYVYGGAVTMMDIPGGGNRVVKSFKHFRRGMT